ncbi:MAG: hypothetical protein ABFD89_10310 [Bryobacteraceae bacterium]
MRSRGPLEQVVRRAHGRIIRHRIFAGFAFALAVVLAGVIALLLLGTQLLDWYWIAVVAAGGLAWGAYRAFSRIPPAIEAAQELDRSLDLNDSLSTAYYFLDAGDHARVSPEIRDAQRQRAEDLARTADPGQAFPFQAPRALYAAGLLGLAAFGLVALRYGLTGSLDLRPPVTRAMFDVFSGRAMQNAAAKERARKQPSEDFPAVAMNASGRVEGLENLQIPAGDELSESAGKSSTSSANRNAAPQGDEASAKGLEEGEQSSDKTGSNTSQAAASDNQRSANNSQAQKQNRPSGENSSLLNKLRDAMNDLLSRLKIPPPGSSNGATEAKENQGTGKQQAKGQRGAPEAGREDARADAQGEQEMAKEGEGTESRRAASGQPGQQSKDAASRKERSGIGKEDGDKGLREAEQLQAMGKIREIFGKRAEDLKGEVTVEVTSSSQRIKTPYSASQAAHSDTGGEINRDEVPLIFQQYVQDYYEQVRKLPPPSKSR